MSPAAGQSYAEAIRLGARIAEIPEKFGSAVLLIEHDMDLVRRACSSVTVFDFGRVIASGPPQLVLAPAHRPEGLYGHRTGRSGRMSALAIENLVVNRAGIPVVRGVNLIAKAGEISVLLGSNGAGKTTLLEGIFGCHSRQWAHCARWGGPHPQPGWPPRPRRGSAMSSRDAPCLAR
jgi:ABC-type branched-subunit amino acid transport system ATPase component